VAAPTSGRHPSAVIGEPPEHRRFRAWAEDLHFPDIDPTALIEAFVTVDSGTVRPTRIGPQSWLMKRVHVGHDAEIGARCEVSPGVVICGHAVLENDVRVGVNASILPFRRIGRGARIGAGAVVTHDVPAGEVWAGVPARPLRSSPAEGSASQLPAGCIA
jgi:acetyltransferase-like isoleucine patch superfamily enzyme